MKKRLLSVLLCVMMTVALLPSFAYAEDGKVIELTDAERPENLVYVTLDEASFPLSNEELETAYLDTLLYGKTDRIDDSTRFVPAPDLMLTPAEYAIEQYLKQEVCRIANGERTSTEFNISLANMGFTSEDYSQVDLTDCVTMLIRDCTAELYWFARRYSYGGNGPSFYICLCVSDAYSGDSDTAVDASKIATARAAISNAQSIVSKYDSYSDVNKLYAYRDEICALVDYNHNYGSYSPSTNPNPWEIVWVFDGDTSTDVVCEGYSKAFEYLCDLSTFQSAFVNCYCVSGNVTFSNGSGGPHMWNIVTMDDGRNYLVDVTNCDGWSDPNIRFLKHAVSGSVSSGYRIDTNDLYPYDSDTRADFTESALTLSTQAYTGSNPDLTPSPRPSATPAPTSAPESDVLHVGDNNVTVPAGETVYCPFVPTKNAWYAIYSTGSFDTYGILADSNRNTLITDDDSGSDNNFKLMRELTAGTTYYIGVKFYSSSDSGVVNIVIEETENPYPGYLEFSTNTIYGEAISSDVIRNYDLVFVNFWAEWCNPCVGELPDLEQLHQDYPNVLFLGVWIGSSLSDAKDTLSEKGVTYPIIQPAGTLTTYRSQVHSIPSTFFFDKNGVQVGDLVYVGSRSYSSWKAIIDDLLEQYGNPDPTPTPTATPTPTPTPSPESDMLQLGDNYVTVPAGETVYCPFIPTKNTWYAIYSTGSFDTYGILSDSNRNTLMTDDDSGSDYNFKLTRELTAGTTYYIGVKFYSSSDSGVVNIVIEETENPYPGYLEFNTNTIYGEAISSDIISDYDLVFVNFWAEWCNPCVSELPDLERLHQDYPNVLFLGVWIGNSLSDAKNTLSELGITYPIIRPAGTLVAYYNQIQYIPSTFFFNKNGVQVGDLIYIGSKSYSSWKTIIDELLAQNEDPFVTPVLNGTIEWNANDVQFRGSTPYVIANGSAQTPRFTAKDDNGNVISPAYYNYTYRENRNAGTGYVTVTFKGAYSGTAQAWFKIYLPPTTTTTVENVSNGIKLTWSPVEGAAGYVIYRRAWSSTTDGWTTFERWNNTTGTTYIDGADANHKVYAGTRYQYGVKAYFARRVDPVTGATIGGNVGDNFNLGEVGPLKTTVRITTRVLNSVTAGSRQMTVKWTPSRNFTGYQIKYATDANFTKNVKAIKITDWSTAEKIITGLTRGTTYYVTIRSYHEFNGMTYFGEWSNVKSCRVK